MQVQKPKIGYKYVNTIFDFFEEVPEDWEIRPLSSFATKINKRFSKYKEGPVLSVTKYKGFVKSLDYFKKQIFSKDIKKYKLVEKGDFAYATIHLDEGSIGLLKEFEYGYISPMYTVFRTDDTINPDFLYLLLKTESYLQKYSAIGEGTVNRRKSVSFENLSKLKIPLPQLEEQNKIASILSNVDSLINQTQKIIEQTQRLKKGLMQRLLTKGIEHTRFKKSKFGFRYIVKEIPFEWKVIPVGNICKSIVPGRNKPVRFDGEIPWLIVDDLDNMFVKDSKSDLKVSKKEIKETSGKIVPPNSVLMSCVGKLGIVAINTRELVMNQQLHAFVCPENLEPYFLAIFLSTMKIYMNAVATTTTVQYMNKENCESIPIVLPNIKEQREIIKIVSDIDNQIQRELEYKYKLEILKKGLMQKLLTGQIRVKT